MEQIRIELGYKVPSDKEFIRWSNEAAALIRKYNWKGRKVSPWGYPERVEYIVEFVAQAPGSTYGSKSQMYLLAKGLTKILNSWEEAELNGIYLKRLSTGKVFKIGKDFAEFMLESGGYEVVE